MKEDKLSDLSMQLSVDVLKLTKELKVKPSVFRHILFVPLSSNYTNRQGIGIAYPLSVFS